MILPDQGTYQIRVMSLFRFPYKVLQEVARLAGFDLFVTKSISRGGPYERVTPKATYAPWRDDKMFSATYDVIKDHTLVDIYRCYELWQLVAESAHHKGALLEVGVWRGGSGALVAKRARSIGIHDPVYLCDTFAGVVKAGVQDAGYRGGEHANTSKKDVETLVTALGLTNVKILAGVFPEETGRMVQDRTFRFCHIDVDVYQSAKDIVEWVWPKLTPGGLIVFDDYGFWTCQGITQFVNEQRGKRDRLVVHNLNGHAIIIKR